MHWDFVTGSVLNIETIPQHRERTQVCSSQWQVSSDCCSVNCTVFHGCFSCIPAQPISSGIQSIGKLYMQILKKSCVYFNVTILLETQADSLFAIDQSATTSQTNWWKAAVHQAQFGGQSRHRTKLFDRDSARFPIRTNPPESNN